MDMRIAATAIAGLVLGGVAMFALLGPSEPTPPLEVAADVAPDGTADGAAPSTELVRASRPMDATTRRAALRLTEDRPAAQRQMGVRGERLAADRAARPQRTEAQDAEERLERRQGFIDDMDAEVRQLAAERSWSPAVTGEVIAELEGRMETWSELRAEMRSGEKSRFAVRRELQAIRAESDARIIALIGEQDAADLEEAVWADRERGPPRGF